jgi:hypothetical protein
MFDACLQAIQLCSPTLGVCLRTLPSYLQFSPWFFGKLTPGEACHGNVLPGFCGFGEFFYNHHSILWGRGVGIRVVMARAGMSMELRYNSISPVLRYNTGLFYSQLLPGKVNMARVSAKLRRLGILQLLQFLQDLITAATGNPNAPTPNPHLTVLQGLYDDGVEKNNAFTAAQDACAAASADRDEQVQSIIEGLTAYINSMESHTSFDAVKLASLALPLRAAPAPPQACGTVTNLTTSTGDDEGTIAAKWQRQPQAASFEVQISPDPVTSSSWTHAVTVTRPRVKVAGLPSGQKRWMRVRAVNDQGPGSWSDPSCRMVP